MPLLVQVFSAFGSFATQSLFGPIMTIAITLVLRRAGQEAFDLEHMMQSIEGPGLPSPDPRATREP